MAILANRVKIKNNLVELSKFTFFSIKKFLSVLLIIASCYLLYFSTPHSLRNVLLDVTGRFLSVGNFIYQKSIYTPKLVYEKLSYLKDLEAENVKLKLQLASFKEIEQFADNTRLENLKLKKILNVVKDIKYDFVTAKIIGTSISPFSSAATIQAGKKDSVNINDVVKGSMGLVGRISKVSDNYSIVMLINDHNSRIPIITGNSKIRGILAKQGDHLQIMYLENNHNAQIGEVVYTSGDGKIYPKNIPVATIEHIKNERVLVRAIENFNELEYVVVESKQH